MQTFILMTKLAPEAGSQVKDRAQQGQAWMNQVRECCPEVKFVAHYALLGSFDFLSVYQAPNPEVAAKVSMISLANGAFMSESLLAIPYKRFTELTKEI